MTQPTSRRSRARLTAALLASALILLTGCKSEVYQNLSETQANAMMAVLLKNGISVEKASDKTGYSISVENDQIVQTLELMRENNLPRPDFENMGQIFAAKGMISSAAEEQARMTYAISQELSETLSQIDGVLTARVHVVLGTQDLATGKTTPPSAAVFLRYTPDSQAPNFVSRIQVLAANSIPGLDPSKVSVMLLPIRDTITVPMLEKPSTESSVGQYLIYGAGVLFALALAGLGFAFALYRKAKGEAKEAAAAKAAEAR